MSRPSVQRFLDRHGKVGIDTSVFIYFMEAHQRYLTLVEPVFTWLRGTRGGAVTSTLTMLELLLQPYRLQKNDLVDGFYALLTTYPNLEWAEVTLAIADRAAQLRAEFNLKTPDSIQAATALVRQATGFVSNDPVFRRIKNLDVLILDELRR
ncbi:MAG: PIN domain-containing protein [Acidobacteriota bacterium]